MVNAGHGSWFLVHRAPCVGLHASWLARAVQCSAVQCMHVHAHSFAFVRPSLHLLALIGLGSAANQRRLALARAPKPADSARTVDASPRLVERPCRPNSSPPPPLLALVTMVSRGLFFAALLAMCGTAQGKLSRALCLLAVGQVAVVVRTDGGRGW